MRTLWARRYNVKNIAMSRQSILKSKIKDELTAKQVVERYIGGSVRGQYVCCFHSDKHPSLTVKGKRWTCWSCGATGDVFDFVGRLYGIDLNASIKLLANDFGFADIIIDDATKQAEIERKQAEKLKREQERARHKRVLELSEEVSHKRQVLYWLSRVRWKKWSEVIVIAQLQNEIEIIDMELDGISR